MSIKTTVGAAVIALTSLFSTQAHAEKPENENTLKISGTLNYLQEFLNSGDKQINPPNEIYLRIDNGGNCHANFSYDAKPGAAFEFNGGRIETANLTCTGKDWGITAGPRMGEQHVRGLFGSPGAAPDVHAHEAAFSLRIDRDDLAGIKLYKETGKWRIDAAAFSALDANENATGVARRGNSSDISWRLRGTYKSGSKSSIGIEGGQNQSVNGPAESFAGVFGNISRPINDNLIWNASGEILRFENFGHTAGQNRNLGLFYTNLTRNFGDRASGWIQGAVNIDNLNPDLGIIEIGGKYTFRNNLSLFLRGDIQQGFSGSRDTNWGGQFGLQYKF